MINRLSRYAKQSPLKVQLFVCLVAFEHITWSSSADEVFLSYYGTVDVQTFNSSMTTDQTSIADEDHGKWLKALERVNKLNLNGAYFVKCRFQGQENNC